jgi:hypothetical protein
MSSNLLFKLKMNWDTLLTERTSKSSLKSSTSSTSLCIWKLTRVNSTSYLMKVFTLNLNGLRLSLVLLVEAKRRMLTTDHSSAEPIRHASTVSVHCPMDVSCFYLNIQVNIFILYIIYSLVLFEVSVLITIHI